MRTFNNEPADRETEREREYYTCTRLYVRGSRSRRYSPARAPCRVSTPFQPHRLMQVLPGHPLGGGGGWRRHCSNPAWSEALQFLSIFALVYNAYRWKPSSHQPGWLEQMYSIYLSISTSPGTPEADRVVYMSRKPRNQKGNRLEYCMLDILRKAEEYRIVSRKGLDKYRRSVFAGGCPLPQAHARGRHACSSLGLFNTSAVAHEQQARAHWLELSSAVSSPGPGRGCPDETGVAGSSGPEWVLGVSLVSLPRRALLADVDDAPCADGATLGMTWRLAACSAAWPTPWCSSGASRSAAGAARWACPCLWKRPGAGRMHEQQLSYDVWRAERRKSESD